VTDPAGAAPLPNTRTAEAAAKLNLFLRVLGRRADGYHDIETVVLPISLADRIQIHGQADPAEFRTLSLSLEVTGEPSVILRVPRDESNLVLRAAAALARRVGVRGFADVVLEKRVPVAAGLGGGSADAAATLRLLNDLWDCRLDVDELIAIGAGVGSDVPALLLEGPALARGRGERVQRVPIPGFRWSVVPFPFEVRTAEAFAWWDQDGASTGPDPSAILEAARQGDVEAMAPLLSNDLQEPVMRRLPEVRRARERMLSQGAAAVIMCGSGPTLAALVPEEGDAAIEGGIAVAS
jgi:4-diphosphocytidyl-2-C-methyl-D-erythritol kinase